MHRVLLAGIRNNAAHLQNLPMDPMKILRGLLIAIVLLVAGAVAVGYALPQRAQLERSIVIERPPATVFTVLNGYRHYAAWSPWAALDPAMQVRVEGPMTGVGAKYSWTSEQAGVGAGSQEILESTPYSRIRTALVFSGTSSINRASFQLTPEGGGTRVVWTHEVEFGADLLGRYFGLLLERMVGPDYERGLANLKRHVETLPAVDFSGLVVDVVQVQARPIAYVPGRSSTEATAIAAAYRDAFARIAAALQREGIRPDGAPLAIGRKWDTGQGLYEFDAAIPVPAGTQAIRTDTEVRLGSTHAGTVLKATHDGRREPLGEHLRKLMAYKQAMGYIDDGAPWDAYVPGPAGPADAERVTETFVPVK